MSDYKRDTLPEILAQIVHFAWDNYYAGDPDTVNLPDDVMWIVAHQCACFLAQYTAQGSSGVEPDITYMALKCNLYMPYEERLELAQSLVKDWDKTY